MDIESYTFEEFKQLAAKFHGYAAPGLLLGGYMVALAKRSLPAGTLFEAVSESAKCLPDAVQLLSLCSMGNQRVRVRDLGRYAVSLYDKHTGEGVRVSIDMEKLRAWPELYAWLMKTKAKKEQDEDELLREIEQAGDTICRLERVRVSRSLFVRRKSGGNSICPKCGESYPSEQGPLCRGCQGEDYFQRNAVSPAASAGPLPAGIRVVSAEEAVGRRLAHDMTRIVPGEFKGTEFTAGQVVTAGDLCRLQKIGRYDVAVVEDGYAPVEGGPVHENNVAEAFALRMAGPNVSYTLPPHEGKIDFTAAIDGLLCVDLEKLGRFNLVPDVMCATRHDATLVQAGRKFAGTRAIPLFLDSAYFAEALSVLGGTPLFSVAPLRRAKMGILVTGSEVFNGVIEDKFIPIMTAKADQYGCDVVRSVIVPDDRDRIADAVTGMMDEGADLIVTTGGMSVDPGDVTRPGLVQAGLKNLLYGMPVLPGAMAMTGDIDGPHGRVQVIGVPACALFFKNTVFDLLLPRLLAGRTITRAEVARLGEGGYCQSCRVCTYPKCAYGK